MASSIETPFTLLQELVDVLLLDAIETTSVGSFVETS